MTTSVNRTDKIAEVKIVGRLSTDEASGFLKEIGPLMEEEGLQINMDLEGLEYISSAGIRCFVMLLKSCRANGSSLKLCKLPPQIRNIFSLTAILDKFEVE